MTRAKFRDAKGSPFALLADCSAGDSGCFGLCALPLFLRFVVGIFDRVCRQHRRHSNFVCTKPLDSKAMVSAKTLKQRKAARSGTCGGTRELENHSVESITSPLSY